MDSNNLKKCSRCKVEKPFSEFSRNKSRKDGLQHTCKSCFAIIQSEYYQANKDKRLEYSKIYRQNNHAKRTLAMARWQRLNPDKVRKINSAWRSRNPEKILILNRNRRALRRKADGLHTAQELLDLWVKQDGKCAYCGCDLNQTEKHLDHVFPLIHGGSNWISNLAWACKFCNLSKGDKILFLEWMPPLLTKNTNPPILDSINDVETYIIRKGFGI